MKSSRILAIGFMVLASSCQRDGGTIGRSRLPGVTGIFVVEDDDRTTALTSAQHTVFYQLGDDRKIIFKGAGGEKLGLRLIGPDTVLLRYCHGSIYKLESSFFDKPNGGGDLRILRLQVVTEPGLSERGRSIC